MHGMPAVLCACEAVGMGNPAAGGQQPQSTATLHSPHCTVHTSRARKIARPTAASNPRHPVSSYNPCTSATKGKIENL